jgi:hypothetical protein
METIFDDPSERDAGSEHHRASGRMLLLFSLVLIVGIVHGVLAFGCYFINEFRRLSPLELAFLCLGDLIGLFWFLRFWLRWQFATPEDYESLGPVTHIPRTVWFMMASMGIGLVSELAMTLNLTYEEYAGFHRAVPAICTLQRVQAQTAAGTPTYWKLDGQYQDAAGQNHLVTYYVRESDELDRLPPLVVLAIRQKQPNIVLPIVYDPKRPNRSWIPHLGWDDGNRLHYFSLLILLFQFLFSLLFLAKLWDSIKADEHLPPWADYHGLIPLGCQAFIMALFGGIEFYFIRRFCP